MEWRHNGSPLPSQNAKCKNPLENSRLDLFVIKTRILLIDYLPKGQTINAEYYLSLLVQMKNCHQRGLVLARQCPGSPGTCNPKESGLPGLPMSWSPNLFSGSGPVGLPSVLWTEKQLKVRHFSSDAKVNAAAETRLGGKRSGFFFEWLAKVRPIG